MKVAIDDIVVPRGRRLRADVTRLAESIRNLGLLHPIAITPDRRLIAGLHRLEACKLLGWSHVPVTVLDLGKVERELVTIDENICRVDLTVLERAEALSRRKELYLTLHPETRKGVAGGLASGASRRGDRTTDIVSPVQSIADRAGVSARTIEREVRIAERIPHELRVKLRGTFVEDDQTSLLRVARMSPEHQAIVVDAIADGRATSLIGAMADAAKQTTPRLPRGTYHTLVIDPPWPYENRRSPYATMSIEDLMDLPISRMLAKDAFVWIWVTNAMFAEAFKCMEAWDVHQKTVLTWAKDRPGTGHWLMGQTEHAILAVRGSPRTTAVGLSTLLHAPCMNHSEKPDAFYDVVERMCPGPRLDMFSRVKRRGWATWGAELDDDESVVAISKATARRK